MIKKLLYILFVMVAATASAQMPLSESFATDKNADAYALIQKPSAKDIIPMENVFDMDAIHAEINNQLIAEDLLEYASTFKGIRYRRGGMSPKGFDCSGFTGYVFSHFGYSLPRTSGDQYNVGAPVEDHYQIQPGDLVFFRGRNARASRVGHVGIAISANPVTGEVTFIHSACSSGITVSTTSEPYYSARFIGARRVIN